MQHRESHTRIELKLDACLFSLRPTLNVNVTPIAIASEQTKEPKIVCQN